MRNAYGIDVLALHFGNKVLNLAIVSLNTDRGENLLHIRGRGGLVTTEGSEHVGSNVTHLDGWVDEKICPIPGR